MGTLKLAVPSKSLLHNNKEMKIIREQVFLFS
jgi:hypothetical protein